MACFKEFFQPRYSTQLWIPQRATKGSLWKSARKHLSRGFSRFPLFQHMTLFQGFFLSTYKTTGQVMSELPKNRKYRKCLKRNSCARKSQFPDTILHVNKAGLRYGALPGKPNDFFLLARIYSSIRSKHMQNYIETKQNNLLIYLNRVFYPPVN